MTGAPPGGLVGGIERTAVELARLAGAEIMAELGGLLAVGYKTGRGGTRYEPVSEGGNRVG